jgi:hypothetical protein
MRQNRSIYIDDIFYYAFREMHAMIIVNKCCIIQWKDTIYAAELQDWAGYIFILVDFEFEFEFCCLTPLSAIFQLYHGDQF